MSVNRDDGERFEEAYDKNNSDLFEEAYEAAQEAMNPGNWGPHPHWWTITLDDDSPISPPPEEFGMTHTEVEASIKTLPINRMVEHADGSITFWFDSILVGARAHMKEA